LQPLAEEALFCAAMPAATMTGSRVENFIVRLVYEVARG